MPSNYTTIVTLTSTRPLTNAEVLDSVCSFGPHVRQVHCLHRGLLESPSGEKIADRAQDGIPEPKDELDPLNGVNLAEDPPITPLKMEITDE